MDRRWPARRPSIPQVPIRGACERITKSAGSIERDTPSLYFALCLSAVWFGCIGACREIIKERPIVERERLFGRRRQEQEVAR